MMIERNDEFSDDNSKAGELSKFQFSMNYIRRYEMGKKNRNKQKSFVLRFSFFLALFFPPYTFNVSLFFLTVPWRFFIRFPFA